MKYIIYQTINLLNNKIYIGQHKTENPDKFDGYIGCGININAPSSYANPCSPLQYAVKKYGVKNFKRITLKVVDTLEEALQIEAELVDYEFLKRPDTYNAQLGGITGYKYKPINQFNLDGTFIKTWNTMQEASEFYNISHTAIMTAVTCKGSCMRYYWSKDSEIDVKTFLNVPEKKVFKYNGETGKFEKMFNSIKEAGIEAEVHPSSIGNAIETGYKIKGSYYSSKMLEEWKGKPKVSIKNKTIYIYDLDGNFLTELHNGKEIREYFKINTTNTITVALRKEKPYKEYQISLTKVNKMPKYEKTHFVKRPILVYDLNGNFIEEMPTIASTIEKYKTRGVQKVLQGHQKQSKGFVFKYKIN